MSQLSDYKIWKLHIPIGRRIGDSMCWYENYTFCVVRLKTTDGLEGWGYNWKPLGGQFGKDWDWLSPAPSVDDMKREYEATYWPQMGGRPVIAAKNQWPTFMPKDNWLSNATNMALWDLLGQEAGLPLYQYFGAKPEKDRKRVYASALGFHQSHDWVCEFFKQKVAEGYTAIKVKLGHEDQAWDLERLQAVRAVVGPDVEISADANRAWDAGKTIERLAYYEKGGVPLAYIEDPINPEDLDGYRLLAKECPIDVVGHDYITDIARMRELMETGGIQRIRIHDSYDYGIALRELAQEYGVTITMCNTILECGIHLAVASDIVERIEFADLAHNLLVEQPVTFENGEMIAPSRPGHGFIPKQERLEEWGVTD